MNRKLERNAYRSSILTFERQLRTFALFLDELKGDVRADLRTLDQARQSFEIQSNAKALADRRVESSELSLQAGRVQVRDVVDAQTSRVQAYNEATASLVDYHLARLRLLLHIGVLKSEQPKFWLLAGDLPQGDAGSVAPKLPTVTDTLITPKQLFEK